MRVCVISNYGGPQDEGIKNVASHLACCLERNCANAEKRDCSIWHVNARRSVLSPRFWRKLFVFRPGIIHCFLRPTGGVFALLRLLKTCCPGARIVVSALQPPLGKLAWLKPNLALVQAGNTERIFQGMGCATAFLPNGVDSLKFAPASAEKKKALRAKYAVPQDKFIILHAGSIKANRNLLVFKEIQAQPDVQAIIVGNTTFAAENEVSRALEQVGCLIWRKYFEHLEEVYQLADCYLFPARDPSSCIELPLSVLEAMSCNLPVITTRFGALPRLFPDSGGGLIFADTAPEMLAAIAQVRQGLAVNNREKVLPYSWENVAGRLQEFYRTLAP